MAKDVDLYTDLYPVLLSLQQLNEMVEDTLMVVGSEAYAAALVAYRYAKEANLGAGLDGVKFWKTALISYLLKTRL